MAVRTPGTWSLAAVAGSLAGIGGSGLRAMLMPWQVGDLIRVARDIPLDAPRAEVVETTHSFGTIGTGASGSHRFEIRNTGGGPLSLTRGSSSCSCTVGDFEGLESNAPDARKVVPPGESTRVTVQWQGKPPGGPFRQQASRARSCPLGGRCLSRSRCRRWPRRRDGRPWS
jgi:hypothetical protein